MKKVMLDQMILTTCCPTNAGSKMLEDYRSPFEATVVTKLKAAGFEIGGKVAVGEMAIDLAGETCFAGGAEAAAAKALENDTACGVICFDVNGAPRRVAAQNSLTFIKPTYGTVSRFGTVAAACSGECVGVMAKSAADCRELLVSIVGHDEKDGTSHPEALTYELALDVPAPTKKVAAVKVTADTDVSGKIEAVKSKMTANGIEIAEVTLPLEAARAAWNILMCAEICNNVSRFDGIKYGYRTKNYKNLDELYTNSRTEAFGLLLKTAILYGSDALSTKNYMAKYDKALRMRRVMVEAFEKLFAEFDAVLLPACSKMAYTESDSAFEENLYTAPASITGLPAVVTDGVQLIGPAFSDAALLSLAKIL